MKNEKIPYGYKMVDGKLEICKEEADKLVTAIERFLRTPTTKEKEYAMKSTVIYTRNSTNVSSETSLSAQVDECINYANENGMTVVELDRDKPSIHKLIENAQADGCDVIVIIKERK